MSKACNRCKVIKPLNDFPVARKRPDGRYSLCMDCKRAGVIQDVDPPSERKCRACGVIKPIHKFSKTKGRRDGRHTKCTRCSGPKHSASPAYYERLKRKVAEKNREVRREMKEMLLGKLGNTCVDCGLQPSEEWPVDCFDFHHEDPSKKELNFARAIGLKSNISKLLVEAEGCVVLCANCHRRRHAK